MICIFIIENKKREAESLQANANVRHCCVPALCLLLQLPNITAGTTTFTLFSTVFFPLSFFLRLCSFDFAVHLFSLYFFFFASYILCFIIYYTCLYSADYLCNSLHIVLSHQFLCSRNLSKVPTSLAYI